MPSCNDFRTNLPQCQKHIHIRPNTESCIMIALQILLAAKTITFRSTHTKDSKFCIFNSFVAIQCFLSSGQLSEG